MDHIYGFAPDLQVLLTVMIGSMDLSVGTGLRLIPPRAPNERLQRHRALLRGLFLGRASL